MLAIIFWFAMSKKVLLCNDPVLLKSINTLKYKETFLVNSKWPRGTKIYRCINQPYLVQLSSSKTGLKLPYGMVPDPNNANAHLCDVEQTKDTRDFVKCVEQHVQLQIFPKFPAASPESLLRLRVTSRTLFHQLDESGDSSVVIKPPPILYPGAIINPVISVGLTFFHETQSRLDFHLDHALVLSAGEPPNTFLNIFCR